MNEIRNPPPHPDHDRDLGFGSVVANRSGHRLLNRDGSFNVERRGLGIRASLHLYYLLLTLSWSRFLLLGAGLYLTTRSLRHRLPAPRGRRGEAREQA